MIVWIVIPLAHSCVFPDFGHLYGLKPVMVPFGKWPETLLGLLIVSLDAPKYTGNRGSSGLVAGAAWSPGRKVDVRYVLYSCTLGIIVVDCFDATCAREKTRDLWYHGYNNYMTHGKTYILYYCCSVILHSDLLQQLFPWMRLDQDI